MWQPSQESEEPKTISDWGLSSEELSKLNISSQSKAQCWFRKRKTELKIIEKTKLCIPAMLKPCSASSFCLPNKNRVGVAHGDGTNLEVVYMATGIDWTGRRAQATRARTTTDVQIGLPRPTDFATVQYFVPYNVWFFWVSRHRSIILAKKMETFSADFEKFQEMC